jgi:hypothetical protein
MKKTKAESKKTETKAINKKELIQMNKDRQLFRLNNLTTVIKFPTNVTFWEQLTCAGYNPQFRRLEAVVDIKQTNGYNGNLCSNGSTEYVRFFVDFHDGNGFQDMGFTSFKVADISNAPPGPQHPISYLAYLFIDDSKYKKFLDCDHAVIPKMRAVLSWNSIPSTNPNIIPHYGNRLDADIQLARKTRFFPVELAEAFKVENLAKYLDPQTEIELKPQDTASAEVLLKTNKAAKVPDERTFYSAIGAKINSNVDFSLATSSFHIENLDKLKVDINKFFDLFNDLEGKKANTTYEELTCLGLNTATDSLGAVIHIKKNAGFNGDLCTRGSMEHVAFWADWNNNGIFDQYLGTVSVNVHDIQNIPKDGLYYNVLLPFDVSRHLKTCDSPNIIRVRAVLSWESLPSTTNPNQLNTWGNYKDALVQLRPKIKSGTGIHTIISYVGNVDRQLIHPTEHLYNYQAVAPNSGNNRPWGGSVNIKGIIDRNSFTGVIKYRLRYKPFGTSDLNYQTVATSVTNSLWNPFVSPFPYSNTQAADSNGWFVYLPDAVNHIFSNDGNSLADWNTNGLTDGRYTIHFEYTDELGNPVTGDLFSVIICNKGITISPTANVSVDTAYDLDLVIDGGDCHSYTPNNPMINGHLRAVHPYFSDWSLNLQPTSHTHGALPSPTSRSYSALSDTGDANGTWSLNTSPLDPCGYTVSIGAHTRVILNSSTLFPYYAAKAVGFAKLP